MGKKGKKKAKITGTPDVVKFKQTREYWLLKECVTIQESLPFVAVEALDDFAFKKVARYMNILALLAEHLQIQSKKDYRFNYHHKYLAPTPQFFPFGYDVEVIRSARLLVETATIEYNDEEYPFSEGLRKASDQFLKDVDNYCNKIASGIEPRLKDDFATGLKKFKLELKEDLEQFDELWMAFELEFVKEHHAILCKVFEPIDRLITLEMLLTQAEERMDIEGKQRMENDFAREVEVFTWTVLPHTKVPGESFPEDVIPLAEACIFYESKCTEEWLHLAKYLIKDYLELRFCIMKIPEERIQPRMRENQQLLRLLRNFHTSVLAAREALDFVSKLPKLSHVKSSDWMTKRLLEPDLRYIQRTAHIASSQGSGFPLQGSRFHGADGTSLPPQLDV